MSELKIKILNPSDWELYKSIRLSSLADSPDSFGSTYSKEALFPDSEWKSRLDPISRARNAMPLIAEIGGQPVGLAWGLMQEPDFRMAHVYQMWVSPKARGKGIAKSLLDQITTWAISKKCDLVALAVTTTNDAAVGLYLASGFVPSGQLEELRDDSVLKVQPMVLELENSA